MIWHLVLTLLCTAQITCPSYERFAVNTQTDPWGTAFTEAQCAETRDLILKQAHAFVLAAKCVQVVAP